MQCLSEDVRSMIRTGVALSSIAQVVEELVLNSIDAGASNIAVRIDLSCFKLQVVDNGHGITEEQFALVGERYATSKCHSVKDLEHLNHFGYRGEALASIKNASSFLEIVSRPKGSLCTILKCFQRGKLSFVSEVAKPRHSTGTTVTVHDLFYNMPVRRCNLSAAIEVENLKYRIAGLALMWPKISITLRDDSFGHVVLQTKKCSGISGVFLDLFPCVKSKDLIELSAEKDEFSLLGFVSKEGHNQKDLQFVYINRRLVLKSWIHKEINKILRRSLIVKRKEMDNERSESNRPMIGISKGSPTKQVDSYGIFLVNVTCPLKSYEITFDPRKTLVEFRDGPKLKDLLQDMIYGVLMKKQLLVAEYAQKTDVFIKKKNDIQEVIVNTKFNELRDAEDTEESLGENTYGTNICATSVSDLVMSKSVRRNIECNICLPDEVVDDTAQNNNNNEAQTPSTQCLSSSEPTSLEVTNLGMIVTEKNRSNCERLSNNDINASLTSGRMLETETDDTTSASSYSDLKSNTLPKGSPPKSSYTVTSASDNEDPFTVRHSTRHRSREIENPLQINLIKSNIESQGVHLITLDQSVEYSSSLKCFRDINPFKASTNNPDISEIAIHTLNELKKATRFVDGFDVTPKTPGVAVLSPDSDQSCSNNARQTRQKWSQNLPPPDVNDQRALVSSCNTSVKSVEMSSDSDLDGHSFRIPEACPRDICSGNQIIRKHATEQSCHVVESQNTNVKEKCNSTISANHLHAKKSSQNKHNDSRSLKLSNKMNRWEKIGNRNRMGVCQVAQTLPVGHGLANFMWSKSHRNSENRLRRSNSSSSAMTEANDEADAQKSSVSKCTGQLSCTNVKNTNNVKNSPIPEHGVPSVVHNLIDISKSQEVNHTEEIQLPIISQNHHYNVNQFTQINSSQVDNGQNELTGQKQKSTKSLSIDQKKLDVEDNDDAKKNHADVVPSCNYLPNESLAQNLRMSTSPHRMDDVLGGQNQIQEKLSSLQEEKKLGVTQDNCFPRELDTRLVTTDVTEIQIAESISVNELQLNTDTTDNTNMETVIRVNVPDLNVYNSTTSGDLGLLSSQESVLVKKSHPGRWGVKKKLTCDTEISRFFSSPKETSDAIENIGKKSGSVVSLTHGDGDELEGIVTLKLGKSEDVGKDMEIVSSPLQLSSQSTNEKTSVEPEKTSVEPDKQGMNHSVVRHSEDIVQTGMTVDLFSDRSLDLPTQSVNSVVTDNEPVCCTNAVLHQDDVLVGNNDVTSAEPVPASKNGISHCLHAQSSDVDMESNTIKTQANGDFDLCGGTNDSGDSVQLAVVSAITTQESFIPKDVNISGRESEKDDICDGVMSNDDNSPSGGGRKRHHSVSDEVDDVLELEGDQRKIPRQMEQQEIWHDLEVGAAEVQYAEEGNLTPDNGDFEKDNMDLEQTFDDDEEISKWREGSSVPRGTSASLEINVSSLMERWKNPVFRNHKSPSLQVQMCPSGKTGKSCFNLVNGLEFSNEMLEHTKVVGQADNKFIACIMDKAKFANDPDYKLTLLVLFDQHAVHERIRLEDLTSDANEAFEKDTSKKLKSGPVKPPIILSISRDDVRVMKAFRNEFERIGVEFQLDESVRQCLKLVIHSLPFCMTRDLDDKQRGVEYMTKNARDLIQDLIQHLKETNGSCGRLPASIHKVLCSKACRGAIKFGDPVTLRKCQHLLKQLSACNLPFQCAHGRPSVVPLINLEGLNDECGVQKVKPSLGKISQQKSVTCSGR